jgi:hypothetical protein
MISDLHIWNCRWEWEVCDVTKKPSCEHLPSSQARLLTSCSIRGRTYSAWAQPVRFNSLLLSRCSFVGRNWAKDEQIPSAPFLSLRTAIAVKPVDMCVLPGDDSIIIWCALQWWMVGKLPQHRGQWKRGSWVAVWHLLDFSGHKNDMFQGRKSGNS